MKIYYAPNFKRQYQKLPLLVQREAEKKEKIFRSNPFDKRLRTHKLKGPLREYWSCSIDYRYRVVFRFMEHNLIFFYAVGDHSVYT